MGRGSGEVPFAGGASLWNHAGVELIALAVPSTVTPAAIITACNDFIFIRVSPLIPCGAPAEPHGATTDELHVPAPQTNAGDPRRYRCALEQRVPPLIAADSSACIERVHRAPRIERRASCGVHRAAVHRAPS
jgi:hypothetical protein